LIILLYLHSKGSHLLLLFYPLLFHLPPLFFPAVVFLSAFSFLSTRFLLKTCFSVISLKVVGGFLDFYELGKYGELCRKRMKRRRQFVSCSFFQCSPNLKKLILENLKVLNFYAYERMIKSLLVFLQSVLRYPFVFVLICTKKKMDLDPGHEHFFRIFMLKLDEPYSDMEISDNLSFSTF